MQVEAELGNRMDSETRPHDVNAELDALLTVGDVARLLKVSRSWVYEHTRARGKERSERLPFIKIGKYTRFDAQSIREFLQRRSKIV